MRLTFATAALLAAGFSVQAGSSRPVPIEVMKTWTPGTGVEPDDEASHSGPRARFWPRPPTARIEALIREAAEHHGVSPALVRAVVEVESGFDPRAVSYAGAQGLMQLTPTTAQRLGVSDCFDVRQNVFAGTRHLRELLDLYAGDTALAIAAYNAGRGAVARHGGVPPYAETREYVLRVTALAASNAGPVLVPAAAEIAGESPIAAEAPLTPLAPPAEAPAPEAALVASAVPDPETPLPGE